MPLRFRFYVGVASMLVLVTVGVTVLQGQRDRELNAFLEERRAFDRSWHADRLISEPLHDDRGKPIRTRLRLKLPIASEPSDEEIRQTLYHPFPFKRSASFTLIDGFYVIRSDEADADSKTGTDEDKQIALRMMDIFTEFIPTNYIEHKIETAPRLLDSVRLDLGEGGTPPQVATLFVSPSGHSAIWIAVDTVVRDEQRKVVARGNYRLSYPDKLNRDDLVEECEALEHSPGANDDVVELTPTTK